MNTRTVAQDDHEQTEEQPRTETTRQINKDAQWRWRWRCKLGEEYESRRRRRRNDTTTTRIAFFTHKSVHKHHEQEGKITEEQDDHETQSSNTLNASLFLSSLSLTQSLRLARWISTDFARPQHSHTTTHTTDTHQTTLRAQPALWRLRYTNVGNTREIC